MLNKLNLIVLKTVLFISLIFFTLLTYAQDNFNEKTVSTYNETLEKIERSLKVKSYDENSLSEMIKQVSKLKSEASDCVSIENVNLEKLNVDLASLGALTKAESAAVKNKRKELNDNILKSEKLLANCRVFVLRSEEALTDLTVTQQKLLAARLFSQGPNIKKLIKESWSQSSLWLTGIHSFLLNNTGVALLSIKELLVLIVIIVIALFSGLFVRKKIIEYINKKMMHDTFANHFSRAFLSVFAHYSPHLLISLSNAIYCYSLTENISPIPFISVVAYGLPIYFALIALVEIFLEPRQPAVPFIGLPDVVSKGLAKRLKVFVLLLFIGYLLFTTLATRSLPDETLLLARGVLVFIFVLNLIWAVRIFGKIPQFSDTVIIRFGIGLILLSVLIVELLGYRNLSAYMTRAVFGSLILFGIFIIISQLIRELFDGLNKGNRKWQRYIRESLGVNSKNKLTAFFWVKFVVVAGLWLGFAVLTLKLWGLSDAGFQQLNIILMEGFTVGSLNIIPARIILALVALTILLAISRWFRARLEHSWLMRTNMERGAREALATISGYVGVALALIISLSITGVEFGNLALIAGALSVGIGFGLQNIVNNFVSGLILLFERPIKTGDWIVVGNTEGYVKRISIRSTQIQTFDQADVIVPNSDLISGQVTNWMLRDVRGRITVHVGVAYGSDTALVHKLLMEVAELNPSVVVDGSSPKPKVLFVSFGDSALLFELRVFIENIDQRFQVGSDLNFAIDAIFREHNIQIPFPQRDVHIKYDSINGPSSETE